MYTKHTFASPPPLHHPIHILWTYTFAPMASIHLQDEFEEEEEE